jgi:hypothetical protein
VGFEGLCVKDFGSPDGSRRSENEVLEKISLRSERGADISPAALRRGNGSPVDRGCWMVARFAAGLGGDSNRVTGRSQRSTLGRLLGSHFLVGNRW